MLYKITTAKPLESIEEALREAAANHQFGLMTVHNLKETMAKKGVEFPRECMIFEVCNPNQAKNVLTRRMDVSTMLPCRISAYEEGGKTVLVTMKPTLLADMFEGEGIGETAAEVEQAMIAIMNEAGK